MGTSFVLARNSLLISLAAVLLLPLIALAPTGSVTAQGINFVNASSVPSAVYVPAANYFYKQGRVSLAAKLYGKAVERDNNATAHYNLGVIHYGRGSFEAAEGEFRKAIEANLNYARAHNSLALLLFYQGRYSEAAAHFRKVVQLSPGNARAYFDLAVSLGNKARYGNGAIADLEEALAHFKEAERLQPGYENANSNIEIVKNILDEHYELQASLKG